MVLHCTAFIRGVSQLDTLQVEATWKLANARMHIEHVVSLMRQHFKILHTTSVIQKNCTHASKCSDVALLGCIVRVPCALNQCSGTCMQ